MDKGVPIGKAPAMGKKEVSWWAWRHSLSVLLVESKHTPYNPVAQHRDVKVDQKASLPSTSAQVREELSFVHGSYMLNRFDFYDYSAGHHHVKAISTIEFEPFVNDWKR